jgi:hypothetical protein
MILCIDGDRAEHGHVAALAYDGPEGLAAVLRLRSDVVFESIHFLGVLRPLYAILSVIQPTSPNQSLPAFAARSLSRATGVTRCAELLFRGI